MATDTWAVPTGPLVVCDIATKMWYNLLMAEMFPEDVTLIRKKFAVSTEVEFVDSTLDDYPCRRGDCGTVMKVTLNGEIIVQWDRGFITTVVPGRESVEVLVYEPHEEPKIWV